ncbi:hypothetical protein Tco_0811755 [Tanacetum coccineum]
MSPRSTIWGQVKRSRMRDLCPSAPSAIFTIMARVLKSATSAISFHDPSREMSKLIEFSGWRKRECTRLGFSTALGSAQNKRAMPPEPLTSNVVNGSCDSTIAHLLLANQVHRHVELATGKYQGRQLFAGCTLKLLKPSVQHEISLPVQLDRDCAATLAKAYSQMYNGKSRHLGVRHSMIRELITNEVISIEFVRSQQNLADHLTKGLARDLVIKSAERMGLKSN